MRCAPTVLTWLKLASLGRFAPHRGDGKFRGAVAVAIGVGAGQRHGGRRFMLEGVSVDPGRTMLPVSPQISLRVESPLSTGTVECCRRARVSEFCFTRSPRDTSWSIRLDLTFITAAGPAIL